MQVLHGKFNFISGLKSPTLYFVSINRMNALCINILYSEQQTFTP